jgi:phosphoenolpyruvate---glycerone phosphotransferase subunit DhaL
MKLDNDIKDRLIAAMAETIASHAGELTDLDRAIGDGDHGSNMKRGFDAVLADRANLSTKPLPDMLKALGTHLVMTIGGASGPLYGTLFMALGKEIPAEPGLADAARALGAAVNAVKARGKATTGEKTMLDVLQPVADALQAGMQNPAGVAQQIKAAADSGLEATKPMKATKGRASFLGERSIGHLDPGSRSSQLLTHAVIGVLAAQPALEGAHSS